LLQPIVLVDHLLRAILHEVVILRGYGHKMNRSEIEAVEHPFIIVSRHSETRLQTFLLITLQLKDENIDVVYLNFQLATAAKRVQGHSIIIISKPDTLIYR
jgi:hypothetical protein